MKFDFFRKKETKMPKEKNTDSFADSLSLEFKRLAIEEILSQLRLNEDKYLSSILKSSFFPIEFITFHPLDNTTALETEEFFRVHSEIDPKFESSFFSNLLLKEYQTNHGARALLRNDCLISIQPDAQSLDDPTLEEVYQISLRGNRKRFRVTVKLGPLKASDSSRTAIPKGTQSGLHDFGSPIRTSDQKKIQQQDAQLAIQVSDSRGDSQILTCPPLIIGRETVSTSDTNKGKVPVSAMYISRHQLNIFELDEQVYAFIPDEAKLTGVLNGSELMEKMRLYAIDGNSLSITFGQPLDTKAVIVEADVPKLYPTIVIRLVKQGVTPQIDSTPIPNVKE